MGGISGLTEKNMEIVKFDSEVARKLKEDKNNAYYSTKNLIAGMKMLKAINTAKGSLMGIKIK